ncbi:hypothetical protein O3P69_002726 [Scylla paramamosain]|uniref:Uncharacterized protein n=1 Tax=Scylla paramamosain TaxID=85552 RepID=A0AAW0UMA2_SCYPA
METKAHNREGVTDDTETGSSHRRIEDDNSVESCDEDCVADPLKYVKSTREELKFEDGGQSPKNVCLGKESRTKSDATNTNVDDTDASRERPAKRLAHPRYMTSYEHTTCLHQGEEDSPEPHTNDTRAKLPGTSDSVHKTLTSGEQVVITLDTLNGEDGCLTTEVDLKVTGRGMKWSRAVMLHKVRARCDGAPFAVRTRLGWTINGPVGYLRLKVITGCSAETVPHKKESQLEVLVRRFWELETEAERMRGNEDAALTIEDKLVVNMWATTIRVVDGHYQLPIPFCNEHPNLPDNQGMAERHLWGLQRRLSKNSDLHERYTREIQLLEKGYAELIPPTETESNPDYTWAVHLETLESLDADAFLNALAWFCAHRGLSECMRSDNGTNMVRADKELKAAVLCAIVGSQVLDEARLNTLFFETEEVINSRPLTPVSEDPYDLEALTPNHLLRVRPQNCLPMAGPLNEDQYRRRRKHVQFLAYHFWKSQCPSTSYRGNFEGLHGGDGGVIFHIIALGQCEGGGGFSGAIYGGSVL